MQQLILDDEEIDAEELAALDDRRGTVSCGRGGHTPRPWCAPSRHPPLPYRRVALPRLRPMHHGPRHAVNTAPREVWLRARAILRARAML